VSRFSELVFSKDNRCNTSHHTYVGSAFIQLLIFSAISAFSLELRKMRILLLSHTIALLPAFLLSHTQA
jgi:hypothetical protein